jgi:L-ribulose-5-phosphate 4-epimerase
MADYADLQERVFAGNRDLVQAGLVVLTFGNVSGVDRSENVLAIKPSGVPYEELRPELITVVELDTGDVVAGSQRPSSDTPTHAVLYRRFEAVGGIVHTHSRFATAWAQAGRELPCFGTTHADHFRGPVPVTRALAADEIEGDYEQRTGDVIVEAFEGGRLDPLGTPAALVASHGPFAWGVDISQAVENAIALETVAELALYTLVLKADASVLDDDLLARHFSRKHGPGAYYGQPR